MIRSPPPDLKPLPMPRALRRLLLALACALTPWAHAAGAAPLTIVAAESTYGAIASAIGGSHVRVVSLIRNPDVDPHSFEATPQAARSVAQARLVLMNGLGYDSWMTRLLAANPVAGRKVLVAAELLPARRLADGNPHVFYDPEVGLRMADEVADWLRHADPTHAADYTAADQAMRARLAGVLRRAADLARSYPRLRVTGTEPVWGYMIRQLGWHNLHQGLQIHVMNGTEPSPREVAGFDADLRARRVSLLIHNRQVDSALTRRMLRLAHACGVPSLGVDEFTPEGTGYPDWLLQSLDAAAAALARPPAPSAACHA